MTFSGGQSGGYLLTLWPYRVLTVWSSAFLVGVVLGAAGLGGGLSLGVGVVLRAVFHGLMESTALAKYDFSTFFSPFSAFSPDPAVPSAPAAGGCGAMLSERPGRLRGFCLENSQSCLAKRCVDEGWIYLYVRNGREHGRANMAEQVDIWECLKLGFVNVTSPSDAKCGQWTVDSGQRTADSRNACIDW